MRGVLPSPLTKGYVPPCTTVVYWAFLRCNIQHFISERSRQSARECRARKKLRYQYLEEQVANREKAVFALHRELDQVSCVLCAM